MRVVGRSNIQKSRQEGARCQFDRKSNREWAHYRSQTIDIRKSGQGLPNKISNALRKVPGRIEK